jgi:hypothetical protein
MMNRSARGTATPGGRPDASTGRLCDLELARERGEIYIDPANDPPPVYQRYGEVLEIATVGAQVMEQSPHRPQNTPVQPASAL